LRWQFWQARELNRGPSRGDPVFAEDAVADLEVELALEIHIARGEREGVRRVGRAARGGFAPWLRLAYLELGEIGGRREQGVERGVGAGPMSGYGASEKRKGRAKSDGAEEERARRSARRSILRFIRWAVAISQTG
jgi:hypothetical protein